MSLPALLGVALAVGATAFTWLAVYVWRMRSTDGAGYVVAMLLAVTVWTICYALELASRTVEVAQWWSGLKFIGIVVLPPALWGFVLRYTGPRAMPRWLLLLLLIEPAIVLGSLAVPSWSHLFHYYPPPGELTYVLRAPVPVVGPLFWPHAIYTYVMMLGASGVLVVRLVRLARPYRRLGALMTLASVLPFLGNLLYNAGVEPLDQVDPTPFLFMLTAVVLVWGFLRLRLLDLLPVVRGAVVARMADAVLVVDAYGRLVYANPSGERMLVKGRRDLVGRSLTDLLPGVATVVGQHQQGATTTRAEVTAEVDGRPTDLSVVVSSVTDPAGRQTASVVVLSDVSDRLRTERRMRDLLQEQTRLAQILQASLRPAELPSVPGAVLAARSVPAGREGQLSGDFFDVHPASHGRWAFVLGDVAGKGVHAAVVTALARYTVRTLSAQGWAPREVLAQLNHALLARDDVERFATVVYAQIQALDDGRLEVTVTLGGHPQPLVRRVGGLVEAVGRPGTALGLLADVDVHDLSVVLEAGDLLLAYTDGVTEARRGREQFGEARLARLLGDVADGASPDVAADAVLGALSQFSTDRDDIALLVLAPAAARP